MKAFLEELKSKYNYDNDMLLFLEKTIPCLISYFGEDKKDLILKALTNCEIHLQKKDESYKEYLNNYFDINKDWDMPSIAIAMYHNQIKATDGKLQSKYIIYLRTGDRKGKNYSPFDFQSENKINTLIHEICHLIKGYNKTKLVGDKIVDCTGLSKDIYSYNPDTGEVSEDCEEINLGIEEAFNEAETSLIAESMTGKTASGGYATAREQALKLIKDKDFAKLVIQSQFNSDDNWMHYFGENDSRCLIECFDVFVKSMHVCYADIKTKEQSSERKEKIDTALEKFIDVYDRRYKERIML